MTTRTRANIVSLTGGTWDLRESGPADASASVLCLAGALCTAPFFEELMAEPALDGVHVVAATLPGHGGTPPPDDMTIESYARSAGELAAMFACDVVVGHSMGANVALEMAAAGTFSGPLVLLAPSLSRKDESMFPRVLDRLGTVLGHLPAAAALKIIGPAMKGSLPPDRLDELVADLHRNDPRVMRQHLRLYLRYLDRHGSVAARLCDAGVPAWVVYGDRDDVGITDDERRTLDQCPRTTIITIPGVGHFAANEEPGRVADIIVQALDTLT